jgi:hypothetical protein
MAQSTGVLYGAAGCYKTWNLGLLSKYIFRKTKKPVRWVTCDGGGYKPIQSLIDAEIIYPLVLTDDPMRLVIMRKIVEGYWPKEIDKNGTRISKILEDENIKNYGGYIFEGVTSIAERLHELYRGKKTGMNPAFSEPIGSDLQDDKGNAIGGGNIGSFSMDSFGLIQGEMTRLLNYSWTLPVPYVWWSGHEAVAEDDITKKVVRGVALVGNAGTPRLAKNVGEMIHAYRVETGEQVINGKKEKTFETRYYFQPHPDNTLQNAFWEAKTRLPGDKIESLLKAFKGGYIVPEYTVGLDAYIETEELLLDQGTDELKEWKAKVLAGDKV